MKKELRKRANNEVDFEDFDFEEKPPKKKKRKHYITTWSQGHCSACGESFDYGDTCFEDGYMYWEWDCPYCKCYGKEYYDLTYDASYNVCSPSGRELKNKD